jgi:hypothetical protein
MCNKDLEKSCPRSDRPTCCQELTQTGIVLGNLLGNNPDNGAVEQLVASEKYN